MSQIDTKKARQKLTSRRRQLEAALARAVLENRHPISVARIADALAATERTEQRYIQRRRRPLFVALFALATILSLLGLFLSSPSTGIQLDARVTFAAFDAAQRGAFDGLESPVMSNHRPFLVDQLKIYHGDATDPSDHIKLGPTQVDYLEVHSHTRIRLSYEPNCSVITVVDRAVDARDTGVVLHTGVLPAADPHGFKPMVFSRQGRWYNRALRPR